MLKKLFWALLMLVASMGLALADVEVNSGDQAALDGIKGVGPAMSKKIIEERTAHGQFKDWADFQKRVKGIGDKNSGKLSQAGLRVNGQAKDGAAAPAASVKPASAAASAATPAASAKPAASAASAASKAASGK
jgi:competence protein ComEA